MGPSKPACLPYMPADICVIQASGLRVRSSQATCQCGTSVPELLPDIVLHIDGLSLLVKFTASTNRV